MNSGSSRPCWLVPSSTVPCPLVLMGMQRYSDIDANAATRPTRWHFLAFGMKWAHTCSWASYTRCSPWPPRTRTLLRSAMAVHSGSGSAQTAVSGCQAGPLFNTVMGLRGWACRYAGRLRRARSIRPRSWSVRPCAVELWRHVCKTGI